MMIDHSSYGIPEKVAGIMIKPLSWQDFKGKPPLKSPYSAHIYWGISYRFEPFGEGTTPKLTVSVYVKSKSWIMRQQQRLIEHEYGHYLIGCLCALNFIKKIQCQLNRDPMVDFGQWCEQILGRCLKEYCAKQRLYDIQTKHYQDRDGQVIWQNKIRKELWEYYIFFHQTQIHNNKKIGHKSNRIQSSRGLSTKINASKNNNNNHNNQRNFSIKQSTKDHPSIRAFKKQSNTTQPKVSISSQVRLYKKLEQQEIKISQQWNKPANQTFSRVLR